MQCQGRDGTSSRLSKPPVRRSDWIVANAGWIDGQDCPTQDFVVGDRMAGTYQLIERMNMTMSSLLPQGESGRLQNVQKKRKKIDNRKKKKKKKGDILEIKAREQNLMLVNIQRGTWSQMFVQN
ncbi:hypothetical protein IFM46972_07908 [Aspergillus udagawae]|uniref:Uncharacterized protein n=1 Tax=Aspergillus udagawae TaxID=91492 RepID=A0A8H3S1B7_9EURO|nr:hypothetical protein IFM46972_07908 [Aspergillus udagawae]